MKSIVWVAAMFVLGTAPVWAQGAKPAPKPASQEAKAPATAHKSRRREDARQCLERASNAEVIKCAEAYL
jgi:hypothetical protein